MHPVIAMGRTLYQQLIVVLLCFVSVIHQDHRITHRLLNASDVDIHSAACQVIARQSATHFLVQFWRAITTIDDNGLYGNIIPS